MEKYLVKDRVCKKCKKTLKLDAKGLKGHALSCQNKKEVR